MVWEKEKLCSKNIFNNFVHRFKNFIQRADADYFSALTYPFWHVL